MLQNDLNKNINSSISSQILTEILNVKENLNSINNSLYIKLQENKRETIEEYKTILSNNLFQNNDKLDSLIQQNTSHLLDKTTILLNEVLPKSNESQLTSIKESIATFEKSVSSDSAKILTAVNKEEQLVHFITSFENKYNQLIQPFCAIVNSSEERLQKQLTLMKSSQIPENLVRDLTDFFNKYKNSSHS